MRDIVRKYFINIIYIFQLISNLNGIGNYGNDKFNTIMTPIINYIYLNAFLYYILL